MRNKIFFFFFCLFPYFFSFLLSAQPSQEKWLWIRIDHVLWPGSFAQVWKKPPNVQEHDFWKTYLKVPDFSKLEEKSRALFQTKIQPYLRTWVLNLIQHAKANHTHIYLLSKAPIFTIKPLAKFLDIPFTHLIAPYKSLEDRFPKIYPVSFNDLFTILFFKFRSDVHFSLQKLFYIGYNPNEELDFLKLAQKSFLIPSDFALPDYLTPRLDHSIFYLSKDQDLSCESTFFSF